MKIKSFVSAVLLVMVFCFNLAAAELTPVKLNKPQKDRGFSVMKTLSVRASVREWNGKPLEIQDLSDLLWAANGINRPEKSMRTAPSYRDVQDISLYVIMKEGAYLYDPKENVLNPVASGDFRPMAAGAQKTVENAAAVLIMVSDLTMIKEKEKCDRIKWAAVDAGIVVENVCLFCAGTGLATVPRATMDVEKLRGVLKLKDTQEPIMNNPVGYGK
jgi:SagB-type dehydrogenase family enzyme